MAHVFESVIVEEFYNTCHGPDGRFCGTKSGGKGRSGGGKSAKRPTQPHKDGSTPLRGKFKITGNKTADAIKITRLDRGSPERKAAAAAFEKAYGPGGKGKPAKRKPRSDKGKARPPKAQPNKDGSEALPGKFKITNNKTADMLSIMRLDRGSPERIAASKVFENHYGGAAPSAIAVKPKN